MDRLMEIVPRQGSGNDDTFPKFKRDFVDCLNQISGLKKICSGVNVPILKKEIEEEEEKKPEDEKKTVSFPTFRRKNTRFLKSKATLGAKVRMELDMLKNDPIKVFFHFQPLTRQFELLLKNIDLYRQKNNIQRKKRRTSKVRLNISKASCQTQSAQRNRIHASRARYEVRLAAIKKHQKARDADILQASNSLSLSLHKRLHSSHARRRKLNDLRRTARRVQMLQFFVTFVSRAHILCSSLKTHLRAKRKRERLYHVTTVCHVIMNQLVHPRRLSKTGKLFRIFRIFWRFAFLFLRIIRKRQSANLLSRFLRDFRKSSQFHVAFHSFVSKVRVAQCAVRRFLRWKRARAMIALLQVKLDECRVMDAEPRLIRFLLPTTSKYNLELDRRNLVSEMGKSRDGGAYLRRKENRERKRRLLFGMREDRGARDGPASPITPVLQRSNSFVVKSPTKKIRVRELEGVWKSKRKGIEGEGGDETPKSLGHNTLTTLNILKSPKSRPRAVSGKFGPEQRKLAMQKLAESRRKGLKRTDSDQGMSRKKIGSHFGTRTNLSLFLLQKRRFSFVLPTLEMYHVLIEPERKKEMKVYRANLMEYYEFALGEKLETKEEEEEDEDEGEEGKDIFEPWEEEEEERERERKARKAKERRERRRKRRRKEKRKERKYLDLLQEPSCPSPLLSVSIVRKLVVAAFRKVKRYEEKKNYQVKINPVAQVNYTENIRKYHRRVKKVELTLRKYFGDSFIQRNSGLFSNAAKREERIRQAKYEIE